MNRIYLAYILVIFSAASYCQAVNEIVLDSLIRYEWNRAEENWEHYYRQVYSYYNNGKLKEQLTSRWDTRNENWFPNERLVPSYDAEGNITRVSQHSRDWRAPEWIEIRNLICNFDESGNLTEQSVYVFNPATNTWAGEDAGIYTYYSGGRLKERIIYKWLYDTESWQRKDHISYQYDELGKQTEEIWKGWHPFNNDWVNWRRTMAEYNSYGDKTLELVCYWNTILNDWQVQSRDEYEYTGQGARTIRVNHSEFDNDHWEWMNSRVEQYDLQGNLTESVKFVNTIGTGEWIKSVQEINLYDSHGRLVEKTWYQWSPLIDRLNIAQRWVYSYDEYGNQTEEITYSWDNYSLSWMEKWKWESYWSPLSTSVPGITAGRDLTIYPNPACGQLTVNFTGPGHLSRIDILDVNGRRVRLVDDINSMPVSISLWELSPGIYFVRCHFSGINISGVHTEKIIIH